MIFGMSAELRVVLRITFRERAHWVKNESWSSERQDVGGATDTLPAKEEQVQPKQE